MGVRSDWKVYVSMAAEVEQQLYESTGGELGAYETKLLCVLGMTPRAESGQVVRCGQCDSMQRKC